jgi:5-methylcytosine-specific restriction endonuclease McrA
MTFAGGQMTNALFINGIFEDVLAEILKAQDARGGGEFYLQPSKGEVIRYLKKRNPAPQDPIRLYASTTENLSQICYTAEVVRWEDKRELSEHRREDVAATLKRDQPSEAEYFEEFDRNINKAVNLVTIQSLRKLYSLHSTSILRKVSDGLPLKKRTRAGGWSEVYDIGDLVSLPVETRDQYEDELSTSVGEASRLPDDVLRDRLASADKIPNRIQVVSVGYRRNPNVIVAVLRRANGVCERCRVKAPFFRRSDGTPYLEIHHSTQLSQGGEDTVENVVALCPNCHRELHHG